MGPFCEHNLILIPTGKSNYIHCEVSGKISYPFQNFNGAAIEVWEWLSNFIPHFTGMRLLIHGGI